MLGSVTLIVVIFTGFLQLRQERQFRIREHFLTGIAAIAQYDIKERGCEQAMRLLDYHSSLALEFDDPELFLILNTVMTDKFARISNVWKTASRRFTSAPERRGVAFKQCSESTILSGRGLYRRLAKADHAL